MHTKKVQDTHRKRLPKSAHSSCPWRIHEIADGFILEDVWRLPTPGGPDDFPLLISIFTSGGPPEKGASPVGRLLWAIRWKLGKWLGWDSEDKAHYSQIVSLREHLPADLRDTQTPKSRSNLFTPLYLIDNEYAAEISNRTMQGIMHLSWVKDDSGPYRGQMAVLVKPNGLFGKLYMAVIKPFRYLFIYPALLRRIERDWSQMQSVDNKNTF